MPARALPLLALLSLLLPNHQIIIANPLIIQPVPAPHPLCLVLLFWFNHITSNHLLNLCLHRPFLSRLSSLLLFPHAESLLHVTRPEQGFTLRYLQSSFDQDLFRLDGPMLWSKLEYADSSCSPTKDFQRELCQQPWEESQPRTCQNSSPHRQCWGREIYSPMFTTCMPYDNATLPQWF